MEATRPHRLQEVILPSNLRVSLAVTKHLLSQLVTHLQQSPWRSP